MHERFGHQAVILVESEGIFGGGVCWDEVNKSGENCNSQVPLTVTQCLRKQVK